MTTGLPDKEKTDLIRDLKKLKGKLTKADDKALVDRVVVIIKGTKADESGQEG